MAEARFSLRALGVGDDIAVLVLSGELDFAAAGALERALERVERRRLVVDLLDVRFIDPVGLDALVRASEARRVSLVVDDPRALRIFETTGAGRRFDLHRTLSDAIAYVEKARSPSRRWPAIDGWSPSSVQSLFIR